MRRQSLTSRVMMSFLCMLFPVSQALAQSILHSFDGDSGPGLAVCQTGVTHCGFPDMNASVNGQQVVQVTWQNIRVYDYNGRLLRSTPMKTFLRDAGLDPIPGERRKFGGPSAPGPFEAHVFFDEFINRWVVTATGVSDSLLVSASPDAMGSWGGVNLGCLQGGPCLDFDPAIRPGYDKNGVYYCGTHLGDSSPNTVAGVAYDCFAVPSAEVQSIAQGTAPAHINRIHNMPHEIFPAIDHNRNKTPGTPAFFMAKTCDRSSPGACQNSNNYSFNWIVDTFTWNGATGTWNTGGEQLVKTDVGSKRNKWLYSKPCCGQSATFPQARYRAVALRAAESHRLTNLVQSGTHLNGVLGSGPCIEATADRKARTRTTSPSGSIWTARIRQRASSARRPKFPARSTWSFPRSVWMRWGTSVSWPSPPRPAPIFQCSSGRIAPPIRRMRSTAQPRSWPARNPTRARKTRTSLPLRTRWV